MNSTLSPKKKERKNYLLLRGQNGLLDQTRHRVGILMENITIKSHVLKSNMTDYFICAGNAEGLGLTRMQELMSACSVFNVCFLIILT